MQMPLLRPKLHPFDQKVLSARRDEIDSLLDSVEEVLAIGMEAGSLVNR